MEDFIKTPFNKIRIGSINVLKKFYSRIILYMICLFIGIAFIRLFLLLKENNYSDIIAYGEKVTALIGALAVLTFTYADTFKSSEQEYIRKIGELFLKSFLYFVIGLIFTIGLYEPMIKPTYPSFVPSILLLFFLLAQIIMFILFWIGFVMLIISAYHLGIGIYKLYCRLT